METKKVKGSDGFGTEMSYEFRILTALEGLEIVHTYGGLLTAALPQIIAVFQAYEDSDGVEDMVRDDLMLGEGPVIELVKLLPAIVSTPRMVQLCKTFLAGAVVDDETCDDNGMCNSFRGHPHRIYAAVVHAIMANFPDYLPFLGDPDDMTDTTSGE